MKRLTWGKLACAVVVLCASNTFAVTNLLTNSGFEDVNTDGFLGDAWGAFFNADFNDFFGGDAHASFFADTAGNSGGVFQTGIAGSEGTTYQFDLMNARIEGNFDADLYAGFEYFEADDTTKLGESLTLLDTATRISNGSLEGNVFSVVGTAVGGTAIVRPVMRFDNVNGAYAGQSQANAFVFDSFMSVAAQPGEEYLKNPGFDDLDSNGTLGDYWGSYGTTDFNAFFGANPHASFFADTIGNSGGVYQQGVLATPGAKYAFQLTNVRVEANFDGDLYFGLEFFAVDDFTKVGESVVLADTTATGDGLRYAMVAEAPVGAYFVRPIIYFDNVATTGGSDRNVFIFSTTLTELTPGVNQLRNPGFLDLNNDAAFGDEWGAYFNAGFNNFFSNPHASLFGDFLVNSGGIYQLGIPACPERRYQFDLLNARIEANWDADLRFGLEYYAADEATKIGEDLVAIDTVTRLANGQIDGNVISMQGTVPAGAAFIRPIAQFDNVNDMYAAEPQANTFIFNTFLGLAPAPGEEHLKNPGFGDLDGDGSLGDYWGAYGNVDFNAFFGAGNPHASFFADTIGNSGGIYQQAVLATPGKSYRLQLENVRIEANFDGELYYGMEFYGGDDFVKIGEAVAQVTPGTVGDGLSFEITGVAVAGAVYVRPIAFFTNVATDGGSQRNAFIFAMSLTELGEGDYDGDGDVDLTDYAVFPDCLGGPDVEPQPIAPVTTARCLGSFDFDLDGDVDLADFAAFTRAID
jgi:hypothetical protein